MHQSIVEIKKKIKMVTSIELNKCSFEAVDFHFVHFSFCL